jgi:hypothetical protein
VTYRRPVLPVQTASTVAYSREAIAGSESLLRLPLPELFYQLVNGYESECVWAACQQIARICLDYDLAGAALGYPGVGMHAEKSGLEQLSVDIEAYRHSITESFQELADDRMGAAERVALTLLSRSPVALTEPCWLDNVSQPGTQPAQLVNDLFRIYCRRLGKGTLAQSAHFRYRTSCECNGVSLPWVASIEFARQTSLHAPFFIGAVYHLAIGRHARLFFPEIVGTTLAYYLLNIDPVSGAPDAADEVKHCEAIFASIRELSGSADWPAVERRILRGFYAEANLESGFWKHLVQTAAQRGRETPRDRMCKLVQRIAPYAHDHHRNVVFEGRPLREWLDAAAQDPRPFVDALGRSGYFNRSDPDKSRFFSLMSFDGPMFAIFTRADARVIKDWARALAATSDQDQPTGVSASDRHDLSFQELAATAGAAFPQAVAAIPANSGGTSYAIASSHCVVAAPASCGLRELFYRLINIDFHPYMLAYAKEYASRMLRDAEGWLVDGSRARYSDATFFEYSPQALEKRVEDIYFNKLIGRYKPAEKMPLKAVLVIRHKMLALGNLIDGTWIHGICKVAQYDNAAANHVFGIYADEMGYGDMRLNHIMVMRRALDSMQIELPEMATREYTYDGSVPEKSFAFLAYELAISCFPHTFFAETLGLNLAIEMYGLGSFRLEEIRQLNHYGFDDSYERLHLTIDNIFTGHVKVAIHAIQAYLDEIHCRLGPESLSQMWRRVWLGYASLVQFVE